MVEIFFQVFLRRRDLKCRYITGHNVLIFYFNLFLGGLSVNGQMANRNLSCAML